jgi:acetyltransferase-like isoleucine patch superfamily enzyme
MIQKLISVTVNFTRRSGGALGAGLGLLLLIPLFTGCPPYNESYHVYYDGNRNTGGDPPVDSRVYFPGDTAVVLEKPEDLKKGNLAFLGWQRSGYESFLQAGDTINIGYESIWLYAWWEDDPYYRPYEYAEDPQNGGVMITRYSPLDGYVAKLIIPHTLDDKPVTAIGEGVFLGLYFSETVVLPGQLVTIGNKAFAGTWIESIVIPDTVEVIGKLAFQNSSLESISLGSGLETIDDYAFDNNRLTVLFLSEKVKTLGEGAFAGNGLISIKIGGNVTIKNNTSLGTYGASFRSYYTDQNSRAGVYLYDSGAWTGPYSKQ